MLLPLFPLQLVVYPGERVALHIFEQRYQQLIKNCEEQQITFGIPTYIDETLDYGTEVRLQKIEKRYPDGESDVICMGLRVFRVQKFYGQTDGYLYASGEVTFLEHTEETPDLAMQEELLMTIRSFYEELDVDNPPQFKLPLMSYDVAHKIGLAMDQEYHLLRLRDEKERLTYLMDHLALTIPVVQKLNRTKRVIKLNGHFKNFDPLDFEGFESHE